MVSALAELAINPQAVKVTTPCPVSLKKLRGLDISARYHADRCAGDFFDGLTLGFRQVFVLMDIAGSRRVKRDCRRGAGYIQEECVGSIQLA